MRIGVAEIKNSRVAVALTLWLAAFAFPVSVRPIVLAGRYSAQATVRDLRKNLFGVRCRVLAKTKLGDRVGIFQVYGNPQACTALQPGGPVTLRLLKAGPLYWVQLDNDFGYWRVQWMIDLVLFVVVNSVLGFIIYRMTRPIQRPRNPADFGALFRNL